MKHREDRVEIFSVILIIFDHNHFNYILIISISMMEDAINPYACIHIIKMKN